MQLALITSISLCLRLPCLLNRCIYFLISYNCSSNGGCHLVKHPRKPACMQENTSILNNRHPALSNNEGQIANCQVKMASDLRGFEEKKILPIPTLQCIKYYMNLYMKCLCYSKILSLVLLFIKINRI